ncbi:MAG: aminoacyl-tRNA hydrolase [Verrucomicrobiota bacterium]
MSNFVVFGLGNPGRQYTNTRHNIGFDVLDFWAGEEGLRWKSCRFADAMSAELSDGEMLFKPQSYMNLSGEVVRNVLEWLKATTWLVVVDDAALSIGRMRLRGKGSSGGHNGLKSIEACLGTQNYARLRIGIGQPKMIEAGEKKMTPDLSDHVLGRFLKEERKILDEVKEKAIKVMKEYRARGLEAAMTLGNTKL